ncbi:hypothetical protein [uncultured Flavonifractor sp.]|uniref:hypothetical protein n=1 Tax=uncultured Flavonifractor sp. TaxID=1193534 RepID=UPI00262C4F34|nr:hypothetical protein [uncultured Flavonifractor sp.]
MDNVILPADLPANWAGGQTVAPNGADVGLPEQYGYNYLMEAVNAAHRTINDLVGAGLTTNPIQVYYNPAGGEM